MLLIIFRHQFCLFVIIFKSFVYSDHTEHQSFSLQVPNICQFLTTPENLCLESLSNICRFRNAYCLHNESKRNVVLSRSIAGPVVAIYDRITGAQLRPVLSTWRSLASSQWPSYAAEIWQSILITGENTSLCHRPECIY